MKNRSPLGISWIVLMMIRNIMFLNNHGYGLLWDIEYIMLMWAGILAIVGLGKKYLNFNNKFTQYFTPAAYPVYLLHQSILVIVAFFVIKFTEIIAFQFILILMFSFVLTLICYEVFKRFSVTCFILGIKKKG